MVRRPCANAEYLPNIKDGRTTRNAGNDGRGKQATIGMPEGLEVGLRCNFANGVFFREYEALNLSRASRVFHGCHLKISSQLPRRLRLYNVTE